MTIPAPNDFTFPHTHFRPNILLGGPAYKLVNILRRIWTGVVAAVAGAALAVLIQVIGQMAMGLPIEYLKWILVACAGVGFLLGVMIGPRRSGTT